MIDTNYETIRLSYQPPKIRYLLIAESPPPSAEFTASSRQFYRTDHVYSDDRLFANTIKALYPKASKMTAPQLELQKDEWLQKFKNDGWYMIEALQESLEHEVTKQQRQELIRQALPALIKRVDKLVTQNTKIILIKSNVFDVATKPLRDAGFNVLNTELLDYPGRFNQRAYREKLSQLAATI